MEPDDRLAGGNVAGRLRWLLPLLMWGALFASGRWVVAAWIRAAGLSHDFQNCYFFLQIVGRLRKDAALHDLPPVEPPGARKRRGRPRKYGLNRLSLVKRATHRHGWEQTTVTVYGAEVAKRTKTCHATYSPVGGTIRVVIVQERVPACGCGPQFFFCTDVTASVREILECFADRAAIEQAHFPSRRHDVKEVWGSGQQQVRKLWASIAA